MSEQAIGQLVTWIGSTSQPTCEHGSFGQCDECDYAHCEPINPAGILSTYDVEAQGTTTTQARQAPAGQVIPREQRCPGCTGAGKIERYNEGAIVCDLCHGTGKKEGKS